MCAGCLFVVVVDLVFQPLDSVAGWCRDKSSTFVICTSRDRLLFFFFFQTKRQYFTAFTALKTALTVM